MPNRTKRKDPIVWHACHCGCNGRETIYRGREFWMGWEGSKWHLFGGPKAHTGHAYFTGGSSAFHVGDFRYSSKKKAADVIRKEYKLYAVSDKLMWHTCGCKLSKRHEAICFRGLRFYRMWNGLRYELYRTHSCKNIRRRYRASEIDEAIRALARKPRPPKKVRTVKPYVRNADGISVGYLTGGGNHSFP
jgi:hypothetical protein